MPSVYITRQGDMPDAIAKTVYGEERYMIELLDANPEHYGTVVFPAEVTLVLPSIVRKIEDYLPPWKRGVSV